MDKVHKNDKNEPPSKENRPFGLDFLEVPAPVRIQTGVRAGYHTEHMTAANRPDSG